MGLDMYLYKKNKRTPDEKIQEVAYWRKANQIRNWIVTYTDYPRDADCEEFLLTKNNLEKLVKDCKTVINDPRSASILMPTQSGFFFGNTEYDKWYFKDLKNTVEQVEKVIKETDWDNEEIYYYEWW